MSGEYRDDGRDLFLLREYREEDADAMALRMLGSYAPEGLLPVRFRRNAGQITAMYRISGLMKLSEAMKGPDPDKILRAVITALSEIGPVLQAYFLSPGQLSLEPSEIFLNADGSVYFLYLLVSDRSFQKSLQILMEFFLRQMNPREEGRVLLLYGLYQKSREETVMPDTLSRLYQEWEQQNGPGQSPSFSEKPSDLPGRRNLPDHSCPEDSFDLSTPEAPFDSPYRTELSDFPYRTGVPDAPTDAEFPDAPPGVGFLNAPTRTDVPNAPSRVDVPDFSFRAEAGSEPFSEKLRAFLKKHRFELLIAGIILVGVILFILI